MNKYIEHYAVNRGATFVFTISQIPFNYFLKSALNKRSSAFFNSALKTHKYVHRHIQCKISVDDSFNQFSKKH